MHAKALPQPPQLFGSFCSLTHVVVPLAPGHIESPVGQVSPHLVPSHVADPPVGAGHAVHDVVPHVATALLLTHLVPHKCCPLGHPQTPAWHTIPLAHGIPHAPQSSVLICRFTHVVPHKVGADAVHPVAQP